MDSDMSSLSTYSGSGDRFVPPHPELTSETSSRVPPTPPGKKNEVAK